MLEKESALQIGRQRLEFPENLVSTRLLFTNGAVSGGYRVM
jgi:hypothetical protein